MIGRSSWFAIREDGSTLSSETTPLTAVQALADVRRFLVAREGQTFQIDLPEGAAPVFERLVRGLARVGLKEAIEPIPSTIREHATMAGWVAPDGRQALVWWMHDGSLRLTEDAAFVDD